MTDLLFAINDTTAGTNIGTEPKISTVDGDAKDGEIDSSLRHMPGACCLS